MESTELSLRPEADSLYQEQRTEYLAQLVAPMDDMWAAFADMAAPHALLVGDEVAGSCCVDEEGRLLRFYVVPRFQDRSVALLRTALKAVEAKQMIVHTVDPNYLSCALEVATSVDIHTLLYARLTESTEPELGNLRVAEPGDHQLIVDFQVGELDAPRGFLEQYVQQRLELKEMLLFEADSRLQCVGELRRDQQQAGTAHLGMVVCSQDRGRGIASRMLTSLVARSQEEGLRPHCSTTVDNVAARRAIERAGFRASHRVLSMGFSL